MRITDNYFHILAFCLFAQNKKYFILITYSA